jgi:hypothetical protein
MRPRFFVEPEAEAELNEAFQWYESRGAEGTPPTPPRPSPDGAEVFLQPLLSPVAAPARRALTSRGPDRAARATGSNAKHEVEPPVRG